MITIQTILYSEDFSDKILPSILSRISDNLYPVNHFTAYQLASRNSSYLKSYAQQVSPSDCSVAHYKDLLKDLDSSQINTAQEWMQTNLGFDYFYIGSKNSLKNSFFTQFLPSAFDLFYSHLIENYYIKQVGTGQGFAFLFNPSAFSNFILPQHSSATLSSSIDYITKTISNLQNDNQYLFELISFKDQEILNLKNQIDSLNQNFYNQSQMTWR